MTQRIKFPDDYKPEKQDIIKNYATVSQIYAHPISPTIVTLVKDLKANKVRYLEYIIVMCVEVCYEKEAYVARTA